MPPINMLIKPASGNCNMRCGYCFYCDVSSHREVASYGIMDEGTQEQLVRKALEYAEGVCTFAFQGGEPTLAGLGYFQNLIRLVEKWNRNKVEVRYALQTNGYGIDREWAAFFAEYQFLIGLSIDGTREIHDLHRKNAAGKGTYTRIMRTVQLFDSYNVEYNILTVVTAQAAKKITGIYRNYVKKGFLYHQYIPCLDPIGEERGQYPHSLTPKLYGQFLMDLFDEWYRDYQQGRFVSVRYFDDLLLMLCGQMPESCGQLGHCTYQMVVEADGEVYPCDFYVMDEYKIGNLNQIDFEQVQKNRQKIGFVEKSLTVEEDCRNCPWSHLCRGGCRRDRDTFDGGPLQKSYFCPSYQMFFRHAAPRLREIARYIQQNSRFPS